VSDVASTTLVNDSRRLPYVIGRSREVL